MRMPLSRIAAYLLVAVAMAFTMVGLLPQSVRADEASGDEGVSTYALSDHTVQGLSPNGTTINLFDYWITGGDKDEWNWSDLSSSEKNSGINSGHTLKFGKGMGNDPENDNDRDEIPWNDNDEEVYNATSENVNKWTHSAYPRIGIVARTLLNGYPVLSDSVNKDESLAYLFNTATNDGKNAYTDVKGLLQVDSEGYYYYNSRENFAEFSADSSGSGNFTLYDQGAVIAAGASANGQFFPFNDGSEVLDSNGNPKGNVTSTTNNNDVSINHYFGMTMSTRFVQQDDGYTAAENGRQVTYNFSGDDDVWIYIDDVLVGDLGGIHDATSIEINFATGRVIVFDDSTDKTPDFKPANTSHNCNNKYDNGERVYLDTTLRELFEDAGQGDRYNWNGDTFPNNTFHTLDFFYLERGNTDSNMSLKYNLVTIPETDIQKIDQVGEPIAGVTFDVSIGGQSVCTATTDENGNVVLLDGNDFPITLNNLFTQYAGESNSVDLTFTETNTPPGYRSAGTFIMSLTKYGDSVLLLSDDKWETGAYALSKVTTTATNEITYTDGSGEARIPTSALQEEDGGNLFVVVKKYADTDDDGTPDTWCPVYGDPLNGWTVLGDGSITSVITAARETGAVFQLASSGNYEATIDGLPGDVLDYVFFEGEGDGSLRGVYYYTTANRWEDVDAGNTYVVTNSNEFERVFSARLLIPNTVNRFIVQKVDETGTPVNGATMALYTSEQVTVDENGVATPKKGLFGTFSG